MSILSIFRGYFLEWEAKKSTCHYLLKMADHGSAYQNGKTPFCFMREGMADMISLSEWKNAILFYEGRNG